MCFATDSVLGICVGPGGALPPDIFVVSSVRSGVLVALLMVVVDL